MASIVAYAIITLSDLKEALDITTPDHDAKLNGYINRATDIIESYVGYRPFTTVYTNEIYSSEGTNKLVLRNWPVTTLTQVQRRTGDFDSPGWETIDTDLYTLNLNGPNDMGVIYMTGGFVKGENNYRVTYTAGFAYASMPNDLQEAAIEIVSYLFNRRRMPGDMRSETLGEYSYTRETVAGKGLIKLLGLEGILGPFRNVPV